MDLSSNERAKMEVVSLRFAGVDEPMTQWLHSEDAYCVSAQTRGCRGALYVLRAAVAAALAVVTFAVVSAATPEFKRPSAVDPPGRVERGKAMGATCVACHGATPVNFGQPAVPAPKLIHQRPTSLFYALHDYRTSARRSVVMEPLVSMLSDQDMRDVASWLGAAPLGAAAERNPLQSRSALGKSVAIQLCAFCHGERGLTVMDGYPALAGQYRDYLRQALIDYRSGARKDPTMQAVARRLGRKEIDAVAEHYALQSGLETLP
jgi:cytochrome c553